MAGKTKPKQVAISEATQGVLHHLHNVQQSLVQAMQRVQQDYQKVATEMNDLELRRAQFLKEQCELLGTPIKEGETVTISPDYKSINVEPAAAKKKPKG